MLYSIFVEINNEHSDCEYLIRSSNRFFRLISPILESSKFRTIDIIAITICHILEPSSQTKIAYYQKLFKELIQKYNKYIDLHLILKILANRVCRYVYVKNDCMLYMVSMITDRISHLTHPDYISNILAIAIANNIEGSLMDMLLKYNTSLQSHTVKKCTKPSDYVSLLCEDV